MPTRLATNFVPDFWTRQIEQEDEDVWEMSALSLDVGGRLPRYTHTFWRLS